jgi:hypothetical protein
VKTRRTVALLVGAVVVGAVLASAVWLLAGALTKESDEATLGPQATNTSTATPAATPRIKTATDCPTPTTIVSTARELVAALSGAHPGDVIALLPGVYSGQFTAERSGTSTAPIWLCGSPDATIDGGDISKGYALHLNAASYWHLDGFTVRGGQKGIVADGSSWDVIENLDVSQVGDEGIHLRANSTNDLVQSNTVSHTGLLKAKYGEGIYVGSAKSNWCSVTNCQPDKSDNNTIRSNRVSFTSAESVDIKEGTTGGKLLDNSFDGTGMVESGADSWVDVKGNSWTIDGNRGVGSVNDGFQTHQILDGWGDRNVFSNNTATVNGPGYGFHLAPALNNVVECNNVVTGAARGTSNISCTDG